MTINVLNLPEKLGSIHDRLGNGACGTIARKYVGGSDFVAKIITFAQKKEGIKEEIEMSKELREVLLEVAISKLCAMFQIGPDVETTIPYDIIVYEDAMQFHLEKCDPVCNPTFSELARDNTDKV